MAAERIGAARCPLCSHNRARLSLSKSGLACLTCDGCNLQLFARSARSDDLLRRLHLPDQAPAAAAQPAPAPPSPPTPTTASKPAATPAPAPAPDVRQRPAWGFLSGIEA